MLDLSEDTLLDRFKGKSAKPVLLEALAKQRIVQGNLLIAKELASKIELSQVYVGQRIIQSTDPTSDMFFILVGEVKVLIKGRLVAKRIAGEHVGELALMDPTAKRSASIVATQDTVVAKIVKKDFEKLAQRYPYLWKEIAVELGNRLRQRNRLIRSQNVKPYIFIGSTTESLPVAYQVEKAFLRKRFNARVWKDGVFGASNFPIEDLERELAYSDFAVMILSPDDIVLSRGKLASVPRDNVIFELGLFIGAISRRRTFLVTPAGREVKLPTDLLGITTIPFVTGENNAQDNLLGAVRQLEAAIKLAGPR